MIIIGIDLARGRDKSAACLFIKGKDGKYRVLRHTHDRRKMKKWLRKYGKEPHGSRRSNAQ